MKLLSFIKSYDAEIIATVLVMVFLACTGYITEKDRQIEIARLCQDQPGLPECDTLDKPKEK
jgi:hypothetical protein